MKKIATLLLCLLSLHVSQAWAKLNVFACEPEWAALASELGGAQVEVFSATTGLQDPHLIQARPSLLARVSLPLPSPAPGISFSDFLSISSPKAFKISSGGGLGMLMRCNFALGG